MGTGQALLPSFAGLVGVNHASRTRSNKILCALFAQQPKGSRRGEDPWGPACECVTWARGGGGEKKNTNNGLEGGGSKKKRGSAAIGKSGEPQGTGHVSDGHRWATPTRGGTMGTKVSGMVLNQGPGPFQSGSRHFFPKGGLSPGLVLVENGATLPKDGPMNQ